MTVKAILEKKGHDVLTLGPNEKLSEAIRILTEHRIGALVITNGDHKIVGILSERDALRSRAKGGSLQVSSTMSRAVITVRPRALASTRPGAAIATSQGDT